MRLHFPQVLDRESLRCHLGMAPASKTTHQGAFGPRILKKVDITGVIHMLEEVDIAVADLKLKSVQTCGWVL